MNQHFKSPPSFSAVRSIDIVSAAIKRIADAVDEIDSAFAGLPEEVKELLDNSVLQQLDGPGLRSIEADLWEG